MEEKKRMTEQFVDEQTANALKFGGIASTNNPYAANFRITAEAAKKDKIVDVNRIQNLCKIHKQVVAEAVNQELAQHVIEIMQ